MGSKTLYTLIIFDMIFLGFLFLYNSEANPNPIFESIVNDIFRSWPTGPQFAGFTGCEWWDVNCHNANLQLATIFVGQVLLWGFTMMGSFFFRIGAIGVLVLQLFNFILPTSATAVPFLNYILIAFQIIIVLEGYSLFRSGNTSA